MRVPRTLEGLALVCRARGRLYALPIEHLVETMRPLPVAPFPSAPPFVRGVSRIRGALVPVVDLGALLAAPEPADPARFVTLSLDGRRVALAVEGVLGIRGLPGPLDALPPLLGAAPAEVVAAIGTLDAELLLVLQTARLVPDSAWEGLDAGGAQ